MSNDRYSQLDLYRRLLLEARPYWLHLFATLVLSLLSTPLALLAPLPMKLAVDSVLGSQPLPRLVQRFLPSLPGANSAATSLLFVVAALLLITLLRQLQGTLSGVLQTYTGERLLQDFRAKLFRQVQRLSLSYHDDKGTSDSAYRIQYDAYCIQAVTLGSLLPLINASITLVGMVYVIARMDWQLALVALTVSPILFLLTRTFRRPLRRRWRSTKALVSAERAFAVFDELPEVIERRNARSITRASGALALRNVCFSYGSAPVLRGISFDVSPGTRVGISGATGAGKTTLASLLMRFY